MKPKYQPYQGSAEQDIYNSCSGPDCPCFNCHNDCITCWAGPLCDFDDDSPCMRRAQDQATQEENE